MFYNKLEFHLFKIVLLVSVFKKAQQLLDFGLTAILGYSTKTGWEKEFQQSTKIYEKSAQVVILY